MSEHDPLPVDTVRTALGAWDLGDELLVEPIPPGATADVFAVRAGSERWVAKYVYDDRAYVEGGLAVSEVLDVAPWQVARPVRTADDGALTRMVEWPPGHEHPLAVLRWVDGRVLEDTASHRDCRALVCGRVHARLLDLDPASVGIDVPAADAPPEPLQDWDLGPNAWLDELFVELRAEIVAWRPLVRCGIAVWDGPDVRIADDGGIGLIDFGHTSWQPLVNVVANRSLTGPDQGAAGLSRFLEVVEGELPLTDEEHAALECFRRYNAAIYARWASMRVHVHDDPAVVEWLDSLLRFLRPEPRPAP